MRLTTALLIGLLTMSAVHAELTATDNYVSLVEAADVQFIYNNEGRLTFIKTADTAEAVDALLAKAPTGLDVTVVEYVSHGKAGSELKYGDEE